MENRRILNWKNLSVIRKGQIIAGAVGGLVTIALHTPIGLIFGEDSPVSNFLLKAWFLFSKPTMAIWKSAGIEGRGGELWFVIAETVINSFLFIIAGTVIGWIVRENKKR
jgi:hypothetical protein